MGCSSSPTRRCSKAKGRDTRNTRPLSTIRATAARHHFQTLDFLAYGFVEDGVGQEGQPGGAGVGVVIFTGFPWTEYARLFGVHSSVPTFLWAGSRGAATPAGQFPL